jgi:hypothetical protein
MSYARLFVGFIFTWSLARFEKVVALIFCRRRNREICQIREQIVFNSVFAYFAYFAVHFFILKNPVRIRVHPAFAACYGAAAHGLISGIKSKRAHRHERPASAIRLSKSMNGIMLLK